MKAMSDVDFVKSSTLEIVVPDASDLDIEETLRLAADKDESALISSISQRNLLFFGMPLLGLLGRNRIDPFYKMKSCQSTLCLELRIKMKSP